ncbi:hypothetical protein C4D60_Mb05t21870 [Musa balbisiana]|uniref:Uncharacterized protein n=1 Tax=Musa balbisiana TaxID=52838 RepID=A0A4S8JXX1_MUSBA|nr:hypothetical protein C4D60_Mb05t21870 [Musa balbisiana]
MDAAQWRQPHSAQVLLQDLQEVLDRGWIPQKCSRRWWLKEEQEVFPFHRRHHRHLFHRHSGISVSVKS